MLVIDAVKNSATENGTAAEESADVVKVQNGEKKRRGRPRKVVEAPAAKRPRGRPPKKAAKKTDDSDDGDDDDDDDEDAEDYEGDSNASDGEGRAPRSGGKGSHGQGSNAKKVAVKPTATEGPKRGRGRPRKNT
jgi:hypothetical protein